MKTLIYLRVSTEDQNPLNQLKDIQTIIDSEFKVIEERQSAYKEDHKRTEFNRIIELIKKREVSVLAVWDLDRIYRNRQKLKGFFELCKMYNVKVLSYRQNFLNELMKIEMPAGFEFIKDMMINNFIEFLGWVAEDESSKKSDRVKATIVKKEGHKTKSKYGNVWGRKGLTKQSINKILQLHNEGLSLRKIQEQVFIYDEYGNKKKNVSIGAVHKIIVENTAEKHLNNEGVHN